MSTKPRRLRPYQAQAIKAWHRDVGNGKTRSAVVLPTGTGKPLAADTPIQTPDGLRRFGDIAVGDLVFGREGRPTKVTAVFEQGVRPVFRVSFSDHTSVLADAEHPWQVVRRRRKPRVMTTAQLMATDMRDGADGWRWRIPMADAVQRPGGDLAVPPYTLGALIANGYLHGRWVPILTTPDHDVIARIKAEHVEVREQTIAEPYCPRWALPGLKASIRAMGLAVPSGEKFIPEAYLQRASVAQRVELLRGLMDADGSSRTGGRRSVHYHTTSRQLALDVQELIWSLGGTASMNTADRTAEGKSIEYTLQILTPSWLYPFGTVRKVQDERPNRIFEPRRAIVSIEPEGEAPVRCIRVDAPDHLFLIGREYIVTHNTDVGAGVIVPWAQERGPGSVLVTAHRDELLNQVTERIAQHDPMLPVGRWQATRRDPTRHITVASIQTLWRAGGWEEFEALNGRPGMVLVDECFPAGTLVGDVPIESICTGDYVDSWDEVTAQPVRRRVTATMRSRPSSLVKVQTDQGDVICTPGHPFLTADGWVAAGALPHGALVLSFTHDATMHGVRSAGRAGHVEAASTVEAQRANLLFDGASRRMGVAVSLTAYGAHEPQVRVAANAGAQPDARSGHAREDGGHAARDRAQAARARRERQAASGRAAGARRSARVADRGDLSHRDRRATLALQAGHRASDDEGLRRGGRRLTLEPTRRGRPARRPVALTRVAGVQVLEPGRDGTYGGLCPRGVVYNLEVEGTHAYRVGAAGLVAHNCHHAVSPSYLSVLKAAGAFAAPNVRTPLLGLTATMVRGDRIGLGDVWQSVAFQRDIGWAIREGFLVVPRGKVIVVKSLHLDDAKVSGGDYQEGELGSMIEQGADEIVDAWVKHAEGRITASFAPTVEAAQAIADEFNDRGIAAGVVTGETPKDERARLYAGLASGDLKVLSGVMVTTEGWDCPAVSCILQCRPTRLPGLYQQIVGRGLRLDPERPEKEDCLVLDVVGASRYQKLTTLVDLYESADIDSTELDDVLPEDEGDPDELTELENEGGFPEEKPRLIGPKEYEDINLFADSGYVWLFTYGGVRFLPAGDRIAVLWQHPKTGKLRAGHCLSKPRYDRSTRTYDRDGVWLRDGWGSLDGWDLDTGRLALEAWVENYAGVLARKSAAWKKAKTPPTEAQIGLATNLGIEDPQLYTKGALADEISIAFASQMLD